MSIHPLGLGPQLPISKKTDLRDKIRHKMPSETVREALQKLEQPKPSTIPRSLTIKKLNRCLDDLHDLETAIAPSDPQTAARVTEVVYQFQRIFKPQQTEISALHPPPSSQQKPPISDAVEQKTTELLNKASALKGSTQTPEYVQACDNLIYEILRTQADASKNIEQALLEIETKINILETNIILDFSTELNTDTITGKQIFYAAQNGWQDVYRELPDGTLEQTHNIKHLKICKLEDGSIVGQYGLEELGKGSFKAIKRMALIHQGAAISYFARLRSIHRSQERHLEETLAKHPTNAKILQQKLTELQDAFTSEISREFSVRTKVHGPGITSMQYVVYQSAKGKKKIRIIMPQYESDLRKVKDISLQLSCSKSVLKGLKILHENRIVHEDIKAMNILVLKGKGDISDFGLARNIGEQLGKSINACYKAPETFNPDETAKPSHDIYSFGIMLLSILDRSLIDDWYFFINSSINPLLLEDDIAKAMEEFLVIHKDLIDRLRTESDPILREFIPALICEDPSKRPSAGEALVIFEQLLAARNPPV